MDKASKTLQIAVVLCVLYVWGKYVYILTYFIMCVTFFSRNFLRVHAMPYVDIIKLN